FVSLLTADGPRFWPLPQFVPQKIRYTAGLLITVYGELLTLSLANCGSKTTVGTVRSSSCSSDSETARRRRARARGVASRFARFSQFVKENQVMTVPP